MHSQWYVPKGYQKSYLHFQGESFRVYSLLGNLSWQKIVSTYLKNSSNSFDVVSSSRATLVKKGLVDGFFTPLYFKHFFLRNGLDKLKHALRASRAKRSLVNDAMLSSEGFSVAKHLCLVEKISFGVVTESILISEEVASSITLRELLEKRECLEELIVRFGEEVAKMHSLNIWPGELHIGNVLYLEKEKQAKFFWLDNERTKKSVFFTKRKLAQNLRDLNKLCANLSPSLKRRFLKAYRQPAP